MHYRSSLSHHVVLQGHHHRPRPATSTAPPPPWAVAAVLWATVSVSLCFGYYGNKQMVVGPNASRMLAVSSVFVRQVRVSGAAGGAAPPGPLLLYGFPGEAPAASSLSNWTLSRLMSVEPYGHRGFSLWLNRGSVLKIRWGVVDDVVGGLNTENVMMVLFKGEKNLELLQQYPTTTSYNYSSEESTTEGVDCSIGEDGSYYVGAANLNPHAVSVSMAVEVSAKVYDVTAATFSCSIGGSSGGGDPCKMELPFPETQYYAVLVTPASDETSYAWYVEISFVARLMTYFSLVGLLAALLWIFLRYVNACSEERLAADHQTETAAPAPAETDPIMAAARTSKAAPYSYGACTEEDPETCRCSSAEDLYEGKLCVICYEEGRNCFFTPCGHCATCQACAKRIMEEEGKICPICRRLVHKVRSLLISP